MNKNKIILKLKNIEVKNSLKKIKFECFKELGYTFGNKNNFKISSNHLIYLLENNIDLENGKYKIYNEIKNILEFPLSKKSSWEDVSKFYKFLCFSATKEKAKKIFLKNYDSDETLDKIWNRYNNKSFCKICKTEIKPDIFYKKINKKTCSKKCSYKEISIRQAGNLNTSYRMSEKTKNKMKDKLSKIMKDKILNGTWTPNVTNSWCHSRVVVDNIPFRSSWEAYFYIYKTYIDKQIIEFEKLRIKYYSSIIDKERIYIVDFIDYKNKMVYEIKPNSCKEDITNIEKEKALKKWCKENKFKKEYISDKWFKENYFKEIINENSESEFKELIQKRLKQFERKIEEIVSLEEINYLGDVYNLHVENNHNYFAEDLIVSNCHGLKFDNKSTDIVYNSENARYRIGMTGTLPEDQIAKMAIMSCVGKPKRYIKTQGLIERGLATPVHINTIHLKYNNEDKALFKYVGNYSKQLVFIKEHKNRTKLIAKLSDKITEKGNTVILCQHIQHMQDIFTEILRLRGIENIEKKHFTGKSAVEFQNEQKVFYVAGATKSKDRDKIFDILRNHQNCIIVSNYQLLSTGLNIKSLKNIVFSSPLKSYTTITQSLGRAIRLHVQKDTAEIYDFVDDFSARGKSGPFYKQYLNRLNLSYIPEGFPITERNVFI